MLTRASQRVRSVFISDVHLGTPGCQAEALLDWVESLTALVEHADGRLEIIDWAAVLRARHQKDPTTLAVSRQLHVSVTALSRTIASMGGIHIPS